MTSTSPSWHIDPHAILTIRAEGPITTGGKMPLAELARLIGSFQATLERIALSVSGKRDARGRRPREVVDAVSLDFVDFDEGSAVLRIERHGQTAWTNDLLAESLEAFSAGVTQINKGAQRAPNHFTPQVINGLRDLTGGIGRGGLTRIGFFSATETICTLDSNFRAGLHRIEQETTSDEDAVIVGRLLMGDFSPASLRCRIDTFAGSVLCDFDADLRDAVLDSMDLLVKAQGRAELQPDGATIRLLHLEDLEVVRETPMRTLATLARQQDVRPVTDIAELQGEPIEDFEDFLETIRSARRG